MWCPLSIRANAVQFFIVYFYFISSVLWHQKCQWRKLTLAICGEKTLDPSEVEGLPEVLHFTSGRGEV